MRCTGFRAPIQFDTSGTSPAPDRWALKAGVSIKLLAGYIEFSAPNSGDWAQALDSGEHPVAVPVLMGQGLHWAKLQLDGNDFGRCFTSCGKADEGVFMNCAVSKGTSGAEVRTSRVAVNAVRAFFPTPHSLRANPAITKGVFQVKNLSGGNIMTNAKWTYPRAHLTSPDADKYSVVALGVLLGTVPLPNTKTLSIVR